MKKVILFFALLLSASVVSLAQDVAASASAKASTGKVATFRWKETTHDFGSIPQGKPASTTFSFTNTGKVPLIISQVQGSCGCTATDYSKEPIAPGKTGYIKATYNAAALGTFQKTVTVTANTEGGPIQLFIKGEVKAEQQ